MQGLFEVALVVGVGVGLILVVGASPIIAVIGGPKYVGAVAPLRIEGAAVLGTCLIPVWNTGLLALHRHSAQLACNLVGLAVIAGVTLGLAPAIGARGAAVATVAGEWTVALGLLLALGRAGRQLLPRMGRIVPRVGLAAAAAAAAMLVPIPALGQLAVAITVYVAIVLTLRAFPKELLELVPARLSRDRKSRG
jgi:O-antigen/teichoic acid export membrane protein